jgi:hypothetical protein
VTDMDSELEPLLNSEISAPAALHHLHLDFSLNVLPVVTHGFLLLMPSRH